MLCKKFFFQLKFSMFWSEHMGLDQDLQYCCLPFNFLKLLLLCANLIFLPYVS
jgi:hypothetical protein